LYDLQPNSPVFVRETGFCAFTPAAQDKHPNTIAGIMPYMDSGAIILYFIGIDVFSELQRQLA
jgi:hypothetical protein